MQKKPEKCLTCNHAIVNFENVHQGWCKFEYEPIVRCDCSPQQYPVGCVCAEIYCIKKNEEDKE